MTCRSVLLASRLPQVFALAQFGEVVVATGQAVIDRRWAEAHYMTTRPGYRGRGAAAAVLAELASRAAVSAAERMYVAVEADDHIAITLYQRSRVTLVHDYQYWTRRA